MNYRGARALELSRLMAYIAICEEGSISAAARRLSIAQSALTVTLQKLEAALDVKLVERGAQGVVSTTPGKLLLQRAYDMIGLAESTFSEVQDRSKIVEGDISIGLTSSTAAVLALPLIERVSQTYPGVTLRLVEAFSGYLWQWLHEGKLDVAIVFDKTSTPEVECKEFGREALHLIGRNEKLLGITHVDVSELHRYPLVMPTALHAIRTLLDSYAMKTGASLDVRMEIDAGQHLLRLVETGKWYSILAPCALGAEIYPRLLAAKPIRPALERGICLAQRRTLMTSPTFKAVRHEIEEEAAGRIKSGDWQARLSE
ncbi:LysR family transcriptional regulator [Rhizobium sp. HT1-10]|uniref:LysR family transcriptional regulator n=1 Tax=Rhizobium sp. HT1-10 TaxID=3111638 RepID=UPI003C2324B8